MTTDTIATTSRPRVICHMTTSIDGRIGTPALFDVEGEGFDPRLLVLTDVERRAGDVIWLRYRLDTGN